MDFIETSVCAPGSAPVVAESRSSWRCQQRVQAHSNVSSVIAALWLWGSAGSRTEGTGSYSSSTGQLHILCKEGVCGWWAGIHAPWGLSYRHWKAGIELRMQFCLTEHVGVHTSSCPCILALVPSCLRSNVCSGVSCYSCWAEQKMVCQAENIWGFNKMPPFRKGDEECVFTGELPFSPGGCETDADELVKVVHSSRNLFWIFSSPFFASQAVFQLLANTGDV